MGTRPFAPGGARDPPGVLVSVSSGSQLHTEGFPSWSPGVPTLIHRIAGSPEAAPCGGTVRFNVVWRPVEASACGSGEASAR